MSRIKRILFTIAATLGLLAPAGLPAVMVRAEETPIRSGLCSGSELAIGAECQPAEAEGTINDMITTVINIFSLVVGIAAVIMIIVGGLKYITSSGDSGNVSGAKNTILYAIIGLVVVALAQVIVRFVLSQADPSGGDEGSLLLAQHR